jgi:hypothetical protein
VAFGFAVAPNSAVPAQKTMAETIVINFRGFIVGSNLFEMRGVGNMGVRIGKPVAVLSVERCG